MMSHKLAATLDFADELEGQLLANEPMSRHTSWRTGGKADYLYLPRNKKDLIRFLVGLPAKMPITWIGLGSNILVRDGGLRGIVVQTSRGLKEIHLQDNGCLYAESGVSCAKVAKVSAENHLSGVEFLGSVPGSIGGALAMNAGAFGGETWDWVKSVECVDRNGKCVDIPAADISYSYRSMTLPFQSWILSGVFSLNQSTNDFDGKAIIRSQRKKRNASQPVQSANAGSVFKNPEGDFAARLIETCGLKGYAIGDAAVSEAHANFIINRDKATSLQIESLINTVVKTVQEATGTVLIPEVRILGEYQ